jgi:hypothetical protein
MDLEQILFRVASCPVACSGRVSRGSILRDNYAVAKPSSGLEGCKTKVTGSTTGAVRASGHLDGELLRRILRWSLGALVTYKDDERGGRSHTGLPLTTI